MKKPANNRTIVEPGDLTPTIEAMMKHDHAVSVSRDGLRLTYDRTGDTAVFAVTRLYRTDKDIPSIHETRIVAGRAWPHMVLSDQPKLHEERIRNDAGTEYVYKGVAWTLKVETVKL